MLLQHNNRRWFAGLIAFACLCTYGQIRGQEPASESINRLTFMTESLAGYQITVPTARNGQRLEVSRIEKPLLRWDNPVSKVPDGTLFLWTDQDARPVAIVQVFVAARTTDLWLHEFQSLLDAPFETRLNGQSLWSPQRPGIEWKPLADGPTPSDSKSGRLVQMRQFAKRFTAEDDFEGQSRWELRLMPTPLHRYGESREDDTVIDGALFAFAHGTDPEALLMLEARQSESGSVWYYALAPMTGYALRVKHQEVDVWSIAERKPPFDPREPFFITRYQP